MTITELEGLVRPHVVAKQLNVTHEWVNRLFDAGKLRGVKTPFGRLIDPASVAEFIEARARREFGLRADDQD